MYFEDSSNGTSLPISLQFAIMESPCHNRAQCKPTGIYSCEDTHRSHSFDAYYSCVCAGGWQGKYCAEDINECLSNPCISPYVCFNNENYYECACPLDNPHCEFELWVIAIIVLAVVLLIIFIITAVYRLKFKRSPLDYETDSHFGSTSSMTGSASSVSDDEESLLDEKPWTYDDGASADIEYFKNPNFTRGFTGEFDNLPPKKGYHNPVLDVEPHYDPDEDRVYHERHTKSTFEPLVPTKYEGDKLPQNIPPVLTTGKRGRVLPALNLDKSSPYYPPPPYQLMDKSGKKKKRRRKKKIGNKDDHHLEEEYKAGRQTPPTQIQRDAAKMFEAGNQQNGNVGPRKITVGPESGFAKIHPTSVDGKASSDMTYDFSLFSKSHPPSHHTRTTKNGDSKSQKVHPMLDSDRSNGFEAHMTSTPNSDALHLQQTNHNRQNNFNDSVNIESEL
ncbi:uncharacterized protein LOC134230436 isoform X2 [Saccostrea cucullata]|uniref:uncharacterized protein LOC134230436 isoform X2 n=1 Tax=Saccostrea cuccullata TaxID=36930 RepID=UPI002ED144CE